MLARRILAIGLVGLLPACLPDPKGDFDKFIAATESQRVVNTGIGDASVDASVEAIDANYFAVCYSSLMAGKMGQTLRFYTEVKVDPTGAGGKAKVTLYPFFATARKFERGLTSNAPLVYNDVTVTPDARFTATLPMVAIEGAANPLSGRDIEMSGVTLTALLYSKQTFCSGFSGDIVKPIQQSFNAICRYFTLKEGDAFDFQDDTEAALPTAFMTIPSVRAEKFSSADFKTCPPAN